VTLTSLLQAVKAARRVAVQMIRILPMKNRM
jgi:hypothetical protein